MTKFSNLGTAYHSSAELLLQYKSVLLVGMLPELQSTYVIIESTFYGVEREPGDKGTRLDIVYPESLNHCS